MDKVFIENKNVDELITELCDPVQYRGYLQAMSYFVGRFSWRNIFLIYKTMPLASMLDDFARWKEYGRTIIRDTKGIKINVPEKQEPKTKMVAKLNPDTGKVMLDENGKKIMEEISIPQPPKFNKLNLFDITQTEGNPAYRFAGNVTTDETLLQVFTDILKAMPPTSVSQEANSDMAFNIWDAVKKITHERLASLDVTGTNDFDLIVESVAYVVCRRFGIGVDMAGLAPTDTGIADMLEIISKQASGLIAIIKDRIVFLCNERSIDPMTLHIPPDPTPEVEPNETPPAELPADAPIITESPAEATQEEPPPNEPISPIVQDKQKQETKSTATATTEETPPAQSDAPPKVNPDTEATLPSAVTATQDETPPPASSEQADTSTKATPPPLNIPEDKASVVVYRLSAEEAAEHGVMDIYDLSRRINIECATTGIDGGIQHHKNDDGYEFVTPTEVLLEEYGKNRMMWVLSKHILTKPGRFSEANRKWANDFVNDGTGSGDKEPTFSIKTHPAVLNAFVDVFREILNEREKPTFSKLLADAKKRSEARNNPGG